MRSWYLFFLFSAAFFLFPLPQIFAQTETVKAQIDALESTILLLKDSSSRDEIETGIATITGTLDRIESGNLDRQTLQRTQLLREQVMFLQTRIDLMDVKGQLRREMVTNLAFRVGGAVVVGAGLGLSAVFVGKANESYSAYEDAVVTQQIESYRSEALTHMNTALIAGITGPVIGGSLIVLPPLFMDLKLKIERRRQSVRDLESELLGMEQRLFEEN